MKYFLMGSSMIPIRYSIKKQLAKINQVLAAEADEVTEVIYGIPWKLKAKKEEGV